MILFIGDVAREQRHREAFQEVDFIRMFGPLAKWVVRIDEAERIPELVSQAFHRAMSGRPGPVVVVLPEDMLTDTAEVAAICDCSRDRMAETLKPTGTFAEVLAGFAERDAGRCATHQDYRRLIDAGKLDAVVIATPDHHHAQAAILACQAGLDVYLEKPLAVTVGEGKRIVGPA